MSASAIASRPPGPRPRVDTHPPFTATFGPAAVELAAAAGLILDPWQADALYVMLAYDPKTLKWVCFECAELVSRQNGKGAILEARVLAGLFLLGEELIMWSAHEYKTAMEGFRRFKKLVKALGVQVDPNNENLWLVEDRLVKFVNTNGEESVELLADPERGYPEQRCRWIARSKGSGRGFSGDVNIIDEAFAYTNEQHEALLPTASARPNPQFIYTSSPPLDGITGDVLFRLRLRGDPDAPRVAEDGPWEQDRELSFRDWGLAGDLEDLSALNLDDREGWRKSNPSLGRSRLTEQAIERERKSMSDAGFARERCGVWPRQIRSGSGVIDLKKWERLKVDKDVAGQPTDVAFSVVVEADRSQITIAAVGPQDDGTLQGSIIDVIRGGARAAVMRMVQLQTRWDPVGWAIEDKGANAALWPELNRVALEAQEAGERLFKEPEDRDKPQRGDIFVPWANDVAAAYGMFVDAVNFESEDDEDAVEFAHVGDVPLDAAVAAAGIRSVGTTGSTWDHRGPVPVSPLKAITNAFWLYKTRAHLVARDLAPNIW